RLVVTGSAVQVVRSFDDLYGRPILTRRVHMPREITRRGYAAVHYAFGYFMLAAVMIVALLVILLNRAVVNRLARVTRHAVAIGRSEEHTSELQSRSDFVCRLLLEKKKFSTSIFIERC